MVVWYDGELSIWGLLFDPWILLEMSPEYDVEEVITSHHVVECLIHHHEFRASVNPLQDFYSRNRLYLFQESQSPIHTPWYQACYTSWHWTQIFARKKLIGYYDNRGKKNLLLFMLRNRKYVHYMWSKFKVVPLESSSLWQTQDL